MALIAMAVYCTEENNKDEMLIKTLFSLETSLKLKGHRLILSVNAMTERTKTTLYTFRNIISEVIYNSSNIGTAEAINKAWAKRVPGENAIKMDDDVVIHHPDWVYLMEESIRRDPKIGQVGLKRRDCFENPRHSDPFYRSTLDQLPHKPGEIWIVVEEVHHVMGTCVMHSAALLDKVGYLKQPKLYGFDDSLMSLRSRKAGFRNVFLTAVDIEHIDPGGTIFQSWKEKHAGEQWDAYHEQIRNIAAGEIYYNPFK